MYIVIRIITYKEIKMKTNEPILTPELQIQEDDNGNIIGIIATLPLLESQDDNGYYIQCPLTKTIGFSAKSIELAVEDHDVDIDIFFKTHLRRKTLKTALASLGWYRVDDHYGFEHVPSYLLKRATSSTRKVTA